MENTSAKLTCHTHVVLLLTPTKFNYHIKIFSKAVLLVSHAPKWEKERGAAMQCNTFCDGTVLVKRVQEPAYYETVNINFLLHANDYIIYCKAPFTRGS